MAQNDYCDGVVVRCRFPPPTAGYQDAREMKSKLGVGMDERGRRMGTGEKSPPCSELSSTLTFEQQCRNKRQQQRGYQRRRNWASGGPGMQAIFLEANQRSSPGTGVFLPRRGGTGGQFGSKPAYSPVLMPDRVIQTLKLNVHELGPQTLKPQPDNELEKIDGNNILEEKKQQTDDVVCLSPGIFLPKEWTY